MWTALVVVGLPLAGWGFSWLSTQVTNLLVRALVALVIALVAGRFLYGFFKQATVPLAEEDPEEVSGEVRLTYVCEMCGLELSVLKVAKDKPPKHCGEDMKLYVER